MTLHHHGGLHYDLLVIAACSAILFFATYTSHSSYKIQPAWTIPIEPSNWKNGRGPTTESEVLPPPLVTDLDGDGTMEIVAAFASGGGSSGKEPFVGVYKTSQYMLTESDSGAVVSPLQEAEATLLPTVKLTGGRRPVALTTGYLDPLEDEEEEEKKGESKKKGGAKKKPSTPRQQVVVVVTSDWTILCFDHDLKLQWEAHAVTKRIRGLHFDEVSAVVSPTGVRYGDRGTVIVGGSLDRDDEMTKTRRKGRVDSLFGEDGDPLHHFNYFAFEGKSGDLRWTHTNQEFLQRDERRERDSKFYYEQNYKLSMQEVTEHVGEVDWRNFRVQLIENLPHKWTRREDTTMKLVHFSRKGKKVADPKSKSNLLDERVKEMDVLGVYRPIDESQPHIASDHIRMPNAVLCHQRHGVEVVHLFSGRPLCHLQLAPGLHADINNDGVIDSVKAVPPSSILRGSVIESIDSSLRHSTCLAAAFTGVPATGLLWNESICGAEGASLLSSLGEKGIAGLEDVDTMTDHHQRDAVYTLVKRYDEVLHSASPLWHPVFLSSTGMVKAISAHGAVMFETATPCSWEVTEDSVSASTAQGNNPAFVPSITAFSLRDEDSPTPDHLLAVGERSMAMLDNEGNTLAEIPLMSKPVASPIVDDSNNNGFNDILIVTAEGIFGYDIETSTASRFFAFAIAGVSFLLLAVFIIMEEEAIRHAKGSSGEGRSHGGSGERASRLVSSSTSLPPLLRMGRAHQRKAKGA
eukprot:CAMPEP_0113870066 /NCGR_PEP_ID=MMETSP0780_2-20120614/1877_1 /TAXON_ID=652834 /ORGANISM="Palpitomonas bilix" /LENGTH=745 /DNA_ID=CAMNT_0000855297 /DNA_START=122 /DNA_END=2359 /DNA_ORIENTATION=+ /assembly_acc=CAM_ASM_000599